MTVNYYNSAGTDLDSLFLVTNGNDGGVGFFNAAGQDLGNRYAGGSSLGYGVGLLNSAGTDLGYLRGKGTAPSITSGVLQVGTWYYYNKGVDVTQDEETFYYPMVRGNGYLRSQVSYSGSPPTKMEVKVTVAVPYNAGGGLELGCKFGSAANLGDAPGNYTAYNRVVSHGFETSISLDVYSGGFVSDAFISFFIDYLSWYNTYPYDSWSYSLKVATRLQNSLGYSGWLEKTLTL